MNFSTNPDIADESQTRSHLPLEFYLGTAIGFLLASLMLNATYGWMSGFYPIPVLTMMFLGLVAGIIRRKIQAKTIASPRYFIRRRWVFILVIWPLCILGPYLGMKAYYWVAATTLPVPPGWIRTEVQTTVLGWDNGAGYQIRMEGTGSKEALQFYRNYFEAKGWSDQSAIWAVSAKKNGEAFTYGRQGDIARISFGILYWGYDRKNNEAIRSCINPIKNASSICRS